jgi:hypothetical protein
VTSTRDRPPRPIDKVDLGFVLPHPAPAPDRRPDDDEFLAELRKAMADDEPLGPRDHDDARVLRSLFDDDEGAAGASGGGADMATKGPT